MPPAKRTTKAAASTPKTTGKPARKPRRKSDTYDAAAIETLEGLEAVRKRPAMYIGDTGQAGLMHLVWEIIDNAVDEAAAGFASKVDVVLYRDGSIEITDNGRGIPVGKHPERDVSALEVVFTELHAGGKFGGGAYSAVGGLHGVGAAVVNAMSTRVDVEVRRDKKLWSLSFKNQQPGHFDGRKFSASSRLQSKPAGRGSGTRVRFWPDLALFDDAAFLDIEQIRERLRNVCFLVPKMTVTVNDRRPDGTKSEFVSKGGLTDLVTEQAGDKAISPVISLTGSETFTENVPVNGQITEVERLCEVEVAMAWTSRFDPVVSSYVNIIPTSDGGTHLAGFDRAVNRVLNGVISDSRKLAKLDDDARKVARDVAQEGLVAAVRVRIPEPQFRGQTKQRLGTPDADGIVGRVVLEQLRAWFDTGGGPRSAVRAISDKVIAAVIARHEARQVIETQRKAAKVGSAGLPPKLADCRDHGPRSELLLVEGDSAAGPAKRGRDSRHMAVLPLRGKIVNAAKASVKQVLDNDEASAIIAAVGAGTGPTFDISASRYGRVVILCDADVDGSHIRCLLLTLIHRHMRPLLEAGRVYAALPPLYTARAGDKVLRAFSDDERDRLEAAHRRGRRGKAKPLRWQRFKGLGEMNTDELRHCALDPETRSLRRLTMRDGAEAARAAEMFDTLMGSDVAARRDYLVEHSGLVDPARLDV